MVDFQKISLEELNELELERQKKLMEMPFVEQKSTIPFINELRFNYDFYQIGPFLINELYDKLELAIINSERLLLVHFIGVKDKKCGRGTNLMQLVCELADKYQYDIELKIDEKQGTPKHVLEKFYRQFGFEYIEEDYLDMGRKTRTLKETSPH